MAGAVCADAASGVTGYDEQYPIHAAVLQGDERRLLALLSPYRSRSEQSLEGSKLKSLFTRRLSPARNGATTIQADGHEAGGAPDIDAHDCHGHSALHLAVMIGHQKSIEELISAGAKIARRSQCGWNAVAEAVSFGNRDIIRMMLRAKLDQSDKEAKAIHPALFHRIEMLPDFKVTIDWDFHTWVPILGRLLPRDTCTLRKRGRVMRLDSTIADFSGLQWTRGNLSYIFRPSASGADGATTIGLDHDRRTFQATANGDADLPEEGEDDFDSTIDALLSQEIVSMQLQMDDLEFTRARCGIYGWSRRDKTEEVAGFMCDSYEVKKLKLSVARRTEHLSEEEVKQLGSVRQRILSGDSSAVLGMFGDEETSKRNHDEGQIPAPPRPSLDPPTVDAAAIIEYMQEAKDSTNDAASCRRLGRATRAHYYERDIHATMAVSNDFPATLADILPVLEILAETHRQFRALYDLVRGRLPPGFPVKLDIPIVATVAATVVFRDFTQAPQDEALFKIPDGYSQVEEEEIPTPEKE